MAKIAKAQRGKKVGDSVPSEMHPGKMIPKSAITKGPYITPKKPAPKKKMKSGGELGMKSVNSGYDDNAGVTRADFVAMGKGEAKHGKKVAKKAKSGMKMMGGGKCKYGC